MSEGVEFVVGARVVLRQPSGWNQPFRSMAEEGRPATIIMVSENRRWDGIRIDFDVKRKGAKPRTLWVEARDLLAYRLETPNEDQ